MSYEKSLRCMGIGDGCFAALWESLRCMGVGVMAMKVSEVTWVTDTDEWVKVGDLPSPRYSAHVQ